MSKALQFCYIQDKNSRFAYTHTAYDLAIIVGSIAFQLSWEAGVRGTAYWEMTLDGVNWVTEVDDGGCKTCMRTDITDIDRPGSIIKVFPRAWISAAYLRFNWVPAKDVGSEGKFSVNLRVNGGGV